MAERAALGASCRIHGRSPSEEVLCGVFLEHVGNDCFHGEGEKSPVCNARRPKIMEKEEKDVNGKRRGDVEDRTWDTKEERKNKEAENRMKR